MTARQGKATVYHVEDTGDRHVAPRTLHEKLEGKAVYMAGLALVTVLIGGIVEFIPAFMMEAKFLQQLRLNLTLL